MMKSAEDFIAVQKLIHKDDRILVAVSGGRDSVALAHFLHTQGYIIGIAHLNYQLRGTDAQRDEEFVREFAMNLTVPFYLKKIEKGELSHSGIQDKARTLRYAFFDEVVEEHHYNRIATAHHLNDSFESFFINLIRGTGLQGLTGIPHQRGIIVRPLLKTTGDELDAYIKDHGLSFCLDHTNTEDKYLRNRVRHHVVTALNDLQDGALHGLESTIDHLSEISSLLHELLKKSISENNEYLEIDTTFFPDNVLQQGVFMIMKNFGFNADQVKDILGSKQNGRLVESEGSRATKHDDMVIVGPSYESPLPISIETVGEVNYLNRTLLLENTTSLELPATRNEALMDAKKVNFPLTLRGWREGDRFQPLGSKFEVKVSDYLTDKKLHRLAKEDALVLTDAKGQIIWLIGVQLSESVKITMGSKTAISLMLSRQ